MKTMFTPWEWLAGQAGSGHPLHFTCEQSLLVRSLAGLCLPPRDTWKAQTWPQAAGAERPEHHCLVGAGGSRPSGVPYVELQICFPQRNDKGCHGEYGRSGFSVSTVRV